MERPWWSSGGVERARVFCSSASSGFFAMTGERSTSMARRSPSLKEKDWNGLLRKFGMVFQRDALFDSITIWENVGFGLRQHTHLTDEEIKAIAIEKLKLVGLENVEDRMPAELSGGMRKRVALARAIAMEPAIILYDEPTTGLDPIMANVINDLMVRMREKLDVTSIVITHDMESAYRIADHIAMLYQGEIIEAGTPGGDQNFSQRDCSAIHPRGGGGADHERGRLSPGTSYHLRR